MIMMYRTVCLYRHQFEAQLAHIRSTNLTVSTLSMYTYRKSNIILLSQNLFATPSSTLALVEDICGYMFQFPTNGSEALFHYFHWDDIFRKKASNHGSR
jgi:hypothetical protein